MVRRLGGYFMDSNDLIEFLKLADLPISVVILMYIVKVLDKRIGTNQAMLEHIIESLIITRKHSNKE